MMLLPVDTSGIEDPPANIEEYVEKASTLVEAACMNDLYDVDTDGLPTDPLVLAAMIRAALVHIKWWISNQVDPSLGVGGISVFNIAESSIGGASIKGNSALAAQQDAARVESLTCLGSESMRILRLSGLATAAVQGLWY